MIQPLRRMTKTRSTQMPSLTSAIAMCLCGLVLTGCNSRPPTYPVSGKVVWKGGEPARELNGGFVTLDSIELMVSALGPIGPDGTFKLGTFEESDGVPACEYTVAVSRPPALEESGAWIPLPRRYESVGSSDLSLTVEPKDNAVTLELERAERK